MNRVDSKKKETQSRFKAWDEGCNQWEKQREVFAEKTTLKVPKNLPKIPAMTESTRRFFRLKAFIYLFQHDKALGLLKTLLKRPFFYAYRYITSLFKTAIRGNSYERDGDFFFYNIKDQEQWIAKGRDPDTPILLGFSYCHKPLECPSGRFTDQCSRDPSSPICGQCFIYKISQRADQLTGLKRDLQIEIIPTVHAIGHAVFRYQKKHPTKKILFLITACEMTLEMFGDWGNMAGIEGIGVRLDGRICNTMKAFELSERGIKPGLTLVLDSTKERMLAIMRALL